MSLGKIPIVSGGTFVNEACIRDGNLVTGRTYRDNPHYMREFMKMLEVARQAGA